MKFPLDQVRTLLAVADEGTLDAAANALHITPSAVSQRIKALELGAGRVLITRTKPVRLTESGEILVRFARQIASLEHDTLGELGMTKRGGPTRLAIAVNADSLATWFLPAIAHTATSHQIYCELHRDDQDHTTELLRQGRVMAAVTSSGDPVQGCSATLLGHMRYLPAASPTFIQQWLRGWPKTPLLEQLPEAPVVVFDRRDAIQDRFIATLVPGRGASVLRHHVPTSEGFVDAVAAGMGWGMVPMAQAEPRLRAGTLVALDPTRAIDVPLYWQQWKLDFPALTLMAVAVAARAQSMNHP